MTTVNQTMLEKSFVQKHPVITFLLINFAWTWAFWLAAVPFRGQDNLLTLALVLAGGFGPALAGVITLRLKSGDKIDFSPKRLLALLLGAAIIFGVFSLRYVVGNIPNYEQLAGDLTINASIFAGGLVASLAGGWVLSSAVSNIKLVQDRMKTLLPWRTSVSWTLLSLIFYPIMILLAWGLSSLLGMGVEYPALWGAPVMESLPYYALTFALVAFAQGGNEEPGWRGLMQPELQNRYSPLVAALIVSVFWSLWHLPLYFNGTYPGDVVGGMIGGFIFRILLSIFLAWFYNRSGGNLFAMVLLHTSFNVMVNFLPTSDAGLLLLWLLVVVIVVIKDKMWRKAPVELG
ncbi:MAG TPA: CPBP family intramembrane glutamic endopeptidase [Anaerolineales bacterium]|nr:CPBP family intramembrane glutamic endopeptidase [Anaerolineales bacterium]